MSNGKQEKKIYSSGSVIVRPGDYERNLIREEEGSLDMIYMDTENNPTGGVGHLLSQAEMTNYGVDINDLNKWKNVDTDQGQRKVAIDDEGNIIKLSKQTTDDWFDVDAQRSIDLANSQWKEGTSDELRGRFASMNYQLGDWTTDFPNAHKAYEAGNMQRFADELKYVNPDDHEKGYSKWYQQMGGDQAPNNRVQKTIDTITRDMQTQEPSQEVIQANAKKKASMIAATEWDMTNVMKDLGQDFKQFKGGDK
jgi:hypothetical protein